MKQGEIYWANMGEGKRRPAIVVSRDTLNRGIYVICVLVTSTNLELRKKLPNCLPLNAGQFGLDRDCVAQAETITLMEIADLDQMAGPIGTLDATNLRGLIRAIGNVIDSDCEPH